MHTDISVLEVQVELLKLQHTNLIAYSTLNIHNSVGLKNYQYMRYYILYWAFLSLWIESTWTETRKSQTDDKAEVIPL